MSMSRIIPGIDMNSVGAEDKKQGELREFISFVRREKGMDLSMYRPTFIKRRLALRMDYCDVSNIRGYISVLENDNAEWDNFLRALSINVSEFFRDKDVFNFFSRECLRKMIRSKELKGHRIINFWSAGCSYGEEPYTLAIILLEALKNRKEFTPYVLATDIEEEALDAAKKGVFREESLKNIPSLILHKYFTKTGRGKWLVNDNVKRIVSFRKHNLFDKPLFKYMDAVFCRNVRIYFDTAKTQQVLLNIYSSLRKEGCLVLGKVENMPDSLEKYFVALERCYKIFQKREEVEYKSKDIQEGAK